MRHHHAWLVQVCCGRETSGDGSTVFAALDLCRDLAEQSKPCVEASDASVYVPQRLTHLPKREEVDSCVHRLD